jgi:hypothetical protein
VLRRWHPTSATLLDFAQAACCVGGVYEWQLTGIGPVNSIDELAAAGGTWALGAPGLEASRRCLADTRRALDPARVDGAAQWQGLLQEAGVTLLLMSVQDSLLTSLMHWLAALELKVVPLGQDALAQPSWSSAAVVQVAAVPGSELLQA